MALKYRVKWIESERGWGQSSWTTDYDTYEQAKAAIDRSNKSNEDDYKKTGIVPDYYIQCRDEIQAVEV